MPESVAPVDRPITLVRQFAIGSVLTTAIVALVLALIFSIEIEGDLVAKDERYAELVVDVIESQMHEHFVPWLENNRVAFDRDDSAQRELVTDIVERNVKGHGILRVNFFAPDGRVQYSTDPTLIGKVIGGPLLARALAGQTATEMREPGAPEDHDGPSARRPLLESYVPASPLDKDGTTASVIEIYQEADALFEAIDRAKAQVAILVVSALLLLLVCNLAIVLKGTRQIADERRKTQAYQVDLRRANLNLEAMTRRLEDRVDDATVRLAAADRLAAVGTLAAGTAHEINTPLATIAACAEGLLRRGTNLGDGCVRQLETIRDEAFRCKQITRNLLDFSRKDAIEDAETVSLIELARASADILAHEAAAHRVDLKLSGSPDLRAMVEPNAMKQVLVNLLKNAIDASNPHGSIEMDLADLPDEDAVEIRITDHGAGIEGKDLPHLLEPFWTTKPPGKGTGLGLSVSYGIVSRHAGRMTITSPGLGQGAVVTIHLPRAKR